MNFLLNYSIPYTSTFYMHPTVPPTFPAVPNISYIPDERSSLNRTKIPFNDLQGISNDQFQVVSDLFTGISLCLRTLSYNKAKPCFDIPADTHLARSG